MGAGTAALSTSQKKELSGAPFSASSANNGLSVSPTGKIVLGNDKTGAAGAAQLLSDREIVTNGFSLFLTDAPTGDNLLLTSQGLILTKGAQSATLTPVALVIVATAYNITLQSFIQITDAGGTSNMNGNTITSGGQLVQNNAASLVRSVVALTNYSAAALGTLANAPVAGNPTKWIAVDDNGTLRRIPTW